MTATGFSHVNGSTTGQYFASRGEMCFIREVPNLLEDTP